MNGTPLSDAAPLAGGASVNVPNTSPYLTQIPMAPPWNHNGRGGTSAAAAGQIAGHAPTQRALMLRILRERGRAGVTDQELQTVAGLPSNSEGPRRWELERHGVVVDSGQRRRTRSGRFAIVWVVAEFAPKPATIALVPPGDAARQNRGAA